MMILLRSFESESEAAHMSDNHITRHREGFAFGYTPITTLDSSINMEFGILKLRKGEAYCREEDDLETAVIIMSGCGDVSIPSFAYTMCDSGYFVVKRDGGVFSKPSTSFLIPKKTRYTIRATEDLEVSMLRANDDGAVPIVRYGFEVADEQRGKAIMDDTSWRIVRTIFDYSNAPKSNIVVGEVINFPGRWSSYPDHAHPQRELYHYRFDPKQGYGLAKQGTDDAFVTRDNDTILIEGGKEHPQVSAPGYRMYYFWAIRHGKDNPYTGFTFSQEHKWLLDPDAKIWSPLK